MLTFDFMIEIGISNNLDIYQKYSGNVSMFSNENNEVSLPIFIRLIEMKIHNSFIS